MGAAKHLQGVRPVPAGITSYAEFDRVFGGGRMGMAEKRLQNVIKRYQQGLASRNDVRRVLELPPVEGWD